MPSAACQEDHQKNTFKAKEVVVSCYLIVGRAAARRAALGVQAVSQG